MTMNHANPPASDTPGEYVLFEWRAEADGTITVRTSQAWDEYHAQRLRPRRLTATRDALQQLYDELYSAPTAQQE